MKKRLLFANIDWFGRRMYTGWGLGIKGYKGVLYLGVMILLISLFEYLSRKISPYFNIAEIIILIVFMADMAFVRYKIYTTKLDEREKKHEYISERNASLTMVVAIAIGIIYQSRATGEIDMFLVIVLFAGLIAKALTNIILDKKD